jgi:hypothetical protein
MRFTWLACLALVAVSRGARAGDEIPEPRLDRIDYAHPEKYVEPTPSLGKKATLEKIAGEIQGATPRGKLGAIGAWIDAHLKYDAKSFDHWRDVDKLLADGTFGGCADHAEIFGGIARACGIPTVWVKTLDLDWIAWFRAHPDEPKSWNGHVFVEVNLEGRWRLYDASQKVLYDAYDVKQRILPGHRLAYDKGDDPYALLLSTRWEDWKKQTTKFVASLDMSLVPVGEGASARIVDDPPGRAYVAATHPAWQWVVDRLNALHVEMGSLSGNGSWEKWLPSARRGILIVPCVDGKTVLPQTYWSLLPVAPGKTREALGDKRSAIVRKKAEDGTDVIMLLALDDDALKAALVDLPLGAPKSATAPAAPPPAGDKSVDVKLDPPGQVYVAGNSPECEWVAKRCVKLGRVIGKTGNCAFERWLPSARRGVLVVITFDGETVLPEAYRSLLPVDAAKVREALKAKESETFRKKAADGTDVVLLAARDKETLRAALESFTLDPPK